MHVARDDGKGHKKRRQQQSVEIERAMERSKKQNTSDDADICPISHTAHQHKQHHHHCATHALSLLPLSASS